MNINNVNFLESYPAASEFEITKAEEKIGHVIPDVYKEFLRLMNGACLDLCLLYGTDDIVERYECNEFAKYAPQYICIGNDNGNSELIMRAESSAFTCGFLDAGALGSAEPEEWFDFKEWLETGCIIKEEWY